jgi:hypothetical protein
MYRKSSGGISSDFRVGLFLSHSNACQLGQQHPHRQESDKSFVEQLIYRFRN